jgi:hypothetical protein
MLTAAVSQLGTSILLLRVLSLFFAALALVAIVKARLSLRVEMLALLIIAIIPLHVHYSTEARAYALCGSAIGLACVALHSWRTSGSARALMMACAALLVAAYSHYYGVLAFPLVVAAALIPGGWIEVRADRRIRSAIVATVALAILYVPGFLLAASQPPLARAWMSNGPIPLSSAVRQFSFAGDFIVMPASPLILQVLGVVTIAAMVVMTARRSETWWWAFRKRAARSIRHLDGCRTLSAPDGGGTRRLDRDRRHRTADDRECASRVRSCRCRSVSRRCPRGGRSGSFCSDRRQRTVLSGARQRASNR